MCIAQKFVGHWKDLSVSGAMILLKCNWKNAERTVIFTKEFAEGRYTRTIEQCHDKMKKLRKNSRQKKADLSQNGIT